MATYDIFKNGGIKIGGRPALKIISLFSITLLPFIVLCLWYNYARFGTIFESGYGLMATRLGIEYFKGTSILTGLHGLLASPGKGFFYYSPIAVLFFFSIGSFARKHPIPALSFVSIIIMYILLYAKYKFWHGDFAWGPRYIFVILPFFIIPIASLFEAPVLRRRTIPNFLVCLIFILSFTIQLASVTVFSYKYLIYLQTAQGVELQKFIGKGAQPIVVPPMETYFDWRSSPIIANFILINEMSHAMGQYKVVALPHETPMFSNSKLDPGMYIYDFWWFQQYFISRDCSWLILGAALFVISLAYAVRISKSVVLLEGMTHDIS